MLRPAARRRAVHGLRRGGGPRGFRQALGCIPGRGRSGGRSGTGPGAAFAGPLTTRGLRLLLRTPVGGPAVPAGRCSAPGRVIPPRRLVDGHKLVLSGSMPGW
ncbi:hypothetical protein ARZXY2_1430 [Arthrobacter sp. ZXY-2]|nr:hypothetical protein ARZXY2_1430 [Arthrobacter sp. ZXY-2]